MLPEDETVRLARKAPQLTLRDHDSQIDVARMRNYRLKRAQEQLVHAECDAAILFDPINIRYTTGTSCHPIFTFHVPTRYAVIPVEGKAVLFETGGLEQTAKGIDTLAQVRTAPRSASSSPALAFPSRPEIGPRKSSTCSAP